MSKDEFDSLIVAIKRAGVNLWFSSTERWMFITDKTMNRVKIDCNCDFNTAAYLVAKAVKINRP
jgi:hypothetical protein